MIYEMSRVMVDAGASWVLWILFALSFASAAVSLERAWVFRGSQGRGKAKLDHLVPRLRSELRAARPESARRELERARSVPARVVLAGLADADRGAAAAEQAMAAACGLERARLEKRLLFLGTVGNNAPFVGLLGTVIGVVGAFEALGKPRVMVDGISDAASVAPERVMGTISEALVATAVGLVVAIPAVALFNYFQARVTTALADAETLGHVLLGQLSGAPGEDIGAQMHGSTMPRARRSNDGGASDAAVAE